VGDFGTPTGSGNINPNEPIQQGGQIQQNIIIASHLGSLMVYKGTQTELYKIIK
jgi:hypothetical protein